jgi:hypothetical protein
MPAVMKCTKELKVEGFGSSSGFQMVNKLAHFFLRGGYDWPAESVITGLKGGTRHLYGQRLKLFQVRHGGNLKGLHRHFPDEHHLVVDLKQKLERSHVAVELRNVQLIPDDAVVTNNGGYLEWMH